LNRSLARWACAAVLLALFLLPGSCGVPNPYEFQNTLTPPEYVDARYDGENIVLKITGFHPTQSAPDFSGYNIYWYRLNAAQSILQQFAYADNLFKPSVSARPVDGRQTARVSFSQWWWSNLSTGVVTREKFSTHDAYFMIVTAYAGRTRTESSYYSIAEVRIPSWATNQTNGDGVPYTNDGPGFSISGGNVFPQNGSSIQSVGWAPSWTNAFGAPQAGYATAPLPLLFSNVYYLFAVNTTTNYAKLWVQQRQGTETVFHWAFLKGSPLL
jgi:hypothetical protein